MKDYENCRLLKFFISFGAFRAVKAFMTVTNMEHKDAQANTVFQGRHLSELRKYRYVQAKLLSNHFNLAVPALKEEQRFLSIIEHDQWPTNRHTVRKSCWGRQFAMKSLDLILGMTFMYWIAFCNALRGCNHQNRRRHRKNWAVMAAILQMHPNHLVCLSLQNNPLRLLNTKWKMNRHEFRRRSVENGTKNEKSANSYSYCRPLQTAASVIVA